MKNIKLKIKILIFVSYAHGLIFSQTFRNGFDNYESGAGGGYGQGTSYHINIYQGGYLLNSESIYMESYLMMFKDTKDKRYLDKFIIHSKRVIERRDDNIRTVYLNTQNTKDTTINKWAINLDAGVNTTTMRADNLMYKNKEKRTNEFMGMNSIYFINPFIKISIGIFYHHFTYYATNNLSNYAVWDVKILLFPIRINFSLYENRKYNINVYAGPEVGKDLTMIGTEYSNGFVNKKYILGYTGVPLFISAGSDINYSISNKILISIGGCVSNQIIPFVGSHNDTFSVSFIAVNLGIRYRFIKSKEL